MKQLQIIIFTIIIILSSITTPARVKNFELSGGVKGGLNFTKITGKEWLEKYNTNLHFGIFAYLNTKRVGVQAEAIYSQATYFTDTNFYGLYKQYYNSAIDSAIKGSFTLTHISIPVMMNLKFTSRVWLQIGPQYTALIDVVDKNNLIQTSKNVFTTGDLSGVAGIWVKLPMHLNVGARYCVGLSNMNDLSTQSSWKYQSIHVHIGFHF